MAKDDYDVIVFTILVYLYACMKRKIIFDKATFYALLSKSDIADEYLADILRLMQQEGLTEGLTITKAWGQTYIVASDISDMSITAAGIKYLGENGKMKELRTAVISAAGMLAELVRLVFPVS